MSRILFLSVGLSVHSDLKAGHVEYVMDKMALGRDFSDRSVSVFTC